MILFENCLDCYFQLTPLTFSSFLKFMKIFFSQLNWIYYKDQGFILWYLNCAWYLKESKWLFVLKIYFDCILNHLLLCIIFYSQFNPISLYYHLFDLSLNFPSYFFIYVSFLDYLFCSYWIYLPKYSFQNCFHWSNANLLGLD